MSSKVPSENTEYPDELARLPRGRHGLPAGFVERNQRERLIAAMTAVIGAEGYSEATITATTEAAGVSSRTFYKYFAGLEECFLAAFDAALEELTVVVRSAFGQEREWPEQVAAVLGAALAHLAGDPAVARLLLVEPFVAGPVIAERYKTALEQAVPYMARGRELRGEEASPLPDSTERGLLGAISSLVSRSVRAGDTARLGELAPTLVQFALTPYLGPAEAAARSGRVAAIS